MFTFEVPQPCDCRVAAAGSDIVAEFPISNNPISLEAIEFSYAATPTNGSLTFETSKTVAGAPVYQVVRKVYITSSGPGPLLTGIHIQRNCGLRITLADGGAAKTLNIIGHKNGGI